MEWIRLKMLVLFLGLIAVSLWQPGCGAKSVTSEASAPPVPLEMPAPAILKFVGYQDMKIDLSKVLNSMPVMKAVDYFDQDDPEKVKLIIWEGPYFFDIFAKTFFAPAMEGIKKIEIPVSADVNTYEAVITFVPTTELNQACWLCLKSPQCEFKTPDGQLCAPDSTCALRTADGKTCTDTSNPYCVLRKPTGEQCKECILRKTNGDACTIEEGWLPRKVKLDFAAFDLDGIGTGKNCSGSTKKTSDTVPVCVRFWLGKGPYTPDVESTYQYEPFLAGVFEQYPYEENPVVKDTIGKGQFRMYVADLGGYESSFAYNYEQKFGGSPYKAATDETLPSKGVEYYFKVQYLPDSPYNINRCAGRFWCIDLSFDKWDWHSTLYQEGPDETAFKSVKLNWDMLDTPTDMQSKYIGQWVEDDIMWSGSFDNECPECTDMDGNSTGVISKHYNICATLDGMFFGIGSTECADVGSRHVNILVDDTPFIDPLGSADVLFPRDFPAKPF